MASYLHSEKARTALVFFLPLGTSKRHGGLEISDGSNHRDMKPCQEPMPDGNKATLCVIYGHAITYSRKSNFKALHKTPHSWVQSTHFDLMTHSAAYTQLGAHASLWVAYGLSVGRDLAVVRLWTGPSLLCVCCFTAQTVSVYILFNKSPWSTSAFPSLTDAAFPFPPSCSIRGLPFCLFLPF